MRADGRLVVVINETGGVERLTHEQVVNIFLGRFRQLPNGLAATPIDRPRDDELMADFYRLLVEVDLRDVEHLHMVMTALEAETDVAAIARHRDAGKKP